MYPNNMNSHYPPMFMNPQNDQLPSTSTQQQRQVFGGPPETASGYRPSSANPMVRVAGGVKNNYMNQWISDHAFATPAFPNFNMNFSPAPSQMSCASGISMNSFMSGMSRLSINTNISFSYPNISNSTSSCKNLPLNIEQVSSQFSFVLGELKRKDFFEIGSDQIAKFANSLVWLVFGNLRGKKKEELIAMKESLPFHVLTQEMVNDLVKAMFSRLVCSQEEQNQMSRKQTQIWEDRVYHLLKNLYSIINVFNVVFDNAFDDMLHQTNSVQGLTNPMHTMYLLLLRPGRKFSYYAVSVLLLLLFPAAASSKEKSDVRRIRSCQKIRKPWMQGKPLVYLMKSLVAIVNYEELNIKAKMSALDVITKLVGSSEGRMEFLNNFYLKNLMQQCFHQNAEADLISRVPALLKKMATPALVDRDKNDENPGMFECFMQQFTSVNGFPALATMLNHGDPRILLGCLQFLTKLGGIGVDEHLRESVSQVLKLVCSSEGMVVEACLKSLLSTVKDSPLLKQLATAERGPQMVIQVLCSEYKTRMEKINAYGTHLLCHLLANDNPVASDAALQLFEDPQTATLVIYRLCRQNLDNSCCELLVMLKMMYSLAPHRMEKILKKRNRITLFEAITLAVFQIRFVDKSESGTQELLLGVVVAAMELILQICREKEVAELFSASFGKISVETDCPINLFGETKNKTLIKDLLLFLAFITSERFSSSLQSLPKIWAKHSCFASLMQNFVNSSDSEVSASAQQLLRLSGV